MPTGIRRDPVAGYHFYVDIEAVFSGTFRECSSLGSTNEVIEYWHAGKAGDTRFAKIPGRVKYENITLKGGVTQDSKKLWDWRKQVQDGKVDDARQNGTVWMFDQANTPVASWKFEGAWPVSLKGPAMNAGNNEVGVEELQIAIEYLEQMQ